MVSRLSGLPVCGLLQTGFHHRRAQATAYGPWRASGRRHGGAPAALSDSLASEGSCWGLATLDAASAPALHTLAQQLEQFAVMRKAQDGIFRVLAADAELRPVRTTVSPDGLKVYNTADRQACVALQVGEGEKVLWVVSSATALVRLGGGSVRINVFPDASTALPKLDIELFHFFGRINMYVNLVPRANLVLDMEYLERFYRSLPPGGGPAWHELYLECTSDPALEPFQTRSADIRALAGQTALFYSAEGTLESTRLMADLARRATLLWLDLRSDSSRTAPSAEERSHLERYNAEHLGFVRKDPDNSKVGDLVGADALEEMLRLSSRDPRILSR